MRTKANGIEIEYETSGNKSDPALLLIMGLGAQLTHLAGRAVRSGLAERGFFVIRYDNRDTGLSTDFGAWGVPDIAGAVAKVMKGEKVDAPYLLDDMAADAIGLLDALGIEQGAHGRRVDGRHDRADHRRASIRSARARWCRSIRRSGRPGLPPGKPEALAMLTAQPEGAAREQLVSTA